MKNYLTPSTGLAVDASVVNGNPGDCEVRGVRIEDGEEMFRHLLLGKNSNNVAEFLAIYAAFEMLGPNTKTPIYSDSQVAIRWALEADPRPNSRNYSVQTGREIANAKIFFQKYGARQLFFWRNRDWGENPADFGRK